MLRHSRISKIARFQLFEMFQSEKNELRLDVLCEPDDCLDDDNISLYDVHDVHVDDFHVHHDVHVDDIGLQDDPPCCHPRWCSTQTWHR